MVVLLRINNLRKVMTHLPTLDHY